MMGERRHLNRDEMFNAIGIIESGRTQADAARALNTGRGVTSRMWSCYEQFGSPEKGTKENKGLPLQGKTDFCALEP